MDDDVVGVLCMENYDDICYIFVVERFSMWFELYCKICQVQSKRKKEERKHQKKKKREKRKSKDVIYVFPALSEIILVFYDYGYYLRA